LTKYNKLFLLNIFLNLSCYYSYCTFILFNSKYIANV
jgi:hypothetical protein